MSARQGPTLSVVGIGQPWRGDDSLGWLVVRGLSERTGVRTMLVGDDVTRVLDVLRDSPQGVIMVDCVRSGAPAGTIHRLDLNQPLSEPSPRFSSHTLSPLEAVALARRLRWALPSRLLLLGMEGADFGPGSELSEPVRSGLDDLVRQVEVEIGRLSPG